MARATVARPFSFKEITLAQASEAFRLRCQAQNLSEGTLTWSREHWNTPESAARAARRLRSSS